MLTQLFFFYFVLWKEPSVLHCQVRGLLSSNRLPTFFHLPVPLAARFLKDELYGLLVFWTHQTFATHQFFNFSNALSFSTAPLLPIAGADANDPFVLPQPFYSSARVVASALRIEATALGSLSFMFRTQRSLAARDTRSLMNSLRQRPRNKQRVGPVGRE